MMIVNGRRLKVALKSFTNIHRPDGRANIFLMTTPRSGSTWLMELLLSQPGFKAITEPLDLRNQQVAEHIGLTSWEQLYSQTAMPHLQHYFENFISGKARFKNQSPRLPHYRFLTHRIVFKILHGGEDRVRWFADTFNGRIIILLRHPIPVSLSRKKIPRLEAYLNSDYRRHFSNAQIRYALDIIENGSLLQKKILSWCLQNSVLLQGIEPDWLVLTYEQMVMEPNIIIETLAHNFELSAPERIVAQLDVPSGTTNQSDRATQAVLEKPRTMNSRQWLVEKWEKRVSEEERSLAAEILATFELDVYQVDDTLPASYFWLQKPA